MLKTALEYIAEARQEMLREFWDVRSLRNKKIKRDRWTIGFDKVDTGQGYLKWTATSDKGESVYGDFGYDPMEPPLNDKEIIKDVMDEIEWNIDEWKKGRKDSNYRPGNA